MVFILKIAILDLLRRDPTGHSLPNLNVLDYVEFLYHMHHRSSDCLDYCGLSEGMST